MNCVRNSYIIATTLHIRDSLSSYVCSKILFPFHQYGTFHKHGERKNAKDCFQSKFCFGNWLKGKSKQLEVDYEGRGIVTCCGYLDVFTFWGVNHFVIAVIVKVNSTDHA